MLLAASSQVFAAESQDGVNKVQFHKDFLGLLRDRDRCVTLDRVFK